MLYSVDMARTIHSLLIVALLMKAHTPLPNKHREHPLQSVPRVSLLIRLLSVEHHACRFAECPQPLWLSPSCAWLLFLDTSDAHAFSVHTLSECLISKELFLDRRSFQEAVVRHILNAHAMPHRITRKCCSVQI